MPDRPTEDYREIIEYSGRHLRVLGPPASGKTSRLLDRFRHLERAGASAAVVTYTRASADRLTAELLAKNSARFGRVPVYTYHMLSREISGSAPAVDSTVIGEMEEAVLLRRVLQRMKKTLTSDYRGTLDSTSFQRTILGVLHALSQNGVTVGDCDALLESVTSRRVRDLLLMYREYRKYLQSKRFMTYHDEAWHAAGLIDGSLTFNPLADVDVILIDDFHDVDPGQYALIRAVAPPDGRASVNVFGDPAGARFRDKGTTDRYLLDVFPRDYAPDDATLPVAFAVDAALGPTVRALMGKTIPGDTGLFMRSKPVNAGGERGPGSGGPEVRLAVADDEFSESSDVADRVAALLASGRYAPSEIAVAAREKRKYESTLARAFGERGLVLETGRTRQHAFAYFVAALLRYVDAPENESAKNSISASPYFASLKETCESVSGRPADSEETAAVEQIRVEVQRTSRMNDGLFDLSCFLKKWAKPVLSSFDAERHPVELSAFLGRLADEWVSYVEVVKSTGGRPSISEFISLSRSLAGDERDKLAVDGRVRFYSCREMSSERFPVVFVLGCSELLFPALPAREDYVPYGLVQDLLRTAITDRPVELHEARTGEEFLKDEYVLLLTTLARADRQLVLTAPEQHRGTSCPAPSRILGLIPDDRIARGITRPPAPFARFVAPFVRGGFEETSSGHRVSDLWAKGPAESRAMEPEVKRLSPSSIKSYTTCPRRYFYERILRIEDEKTVAMTFGTLFHNLMKSLSREHRTHAALRSVIRSEQLNDYIDREIEGSDAFAGAAEIVKQALRFHLHDMTNRFVELDAARTDDYRIAGAEERVDFEHGGRPFGGIADRIDEGPAGARVVIDYKTGAGINKKGETVRKKALPGFDDLGERLWQVPLYLRGARPEDGPDPLMFCYYVIRPGDEDYVAGLYVGAEGVVDAASVFDEKLKKRFAHLTRAELEACLDEASDVAAQVFADKTEYARTGDRDHCSNCYFRRVCERTA